MFHKEGYTIILSSLVISAISVFLIDKYVPTAWLNLALTILVLFLLVTDNCCLMVVKMGGCPPMFSYENKTWGIRFTIRLWRIFLKS